MEIRALRVPRLRTVEAEGSERHPTWTELFYDLVFVVAVAALGRRLLEDGSWSGVLGFVGLFIPVWWAWAGFTFYADRYDTDDLGQRLLTIAQMCTIALMAASVSGTQADSSVVFALSYVGARAILNVMYLRAGHHVPETRQLVSGYIRGDSVATLVWVVSVFVPSPARFVLWGVGLAISFYTPYAVRKIQAKVPLDTSHLPERMGLFIILVFGESIAAVVAGLAEQTWAFQPTLLAVLAVLVATGLWWVYFDNLEGSVVRRLAGQKTAWKPTVWIYAHLPLAIALTATGNGLENLVAHPAHDPLHALPAPDRWLLAGGMAFTLLAMALIQIATVSTRPWRHAARARHRTAGAIAAIVLGAVGGYLTVELFALAAAAIAAGQVAADLLSDHRGRPSRAGAQ
jgi:low temperature requirement protein LtrA